MDDGILRNRLEEFYREYQERSFSENEITAAIYGEGSFSIDKLHALLSPNASRFLEEMALVAQNNSKKFFGNAVKLFTPMYISNYCSNGCKYCAFKADNKIVRKQLENNEIVQEAKVISETGLRQVLVLTGEAKNVTTFEYLKNAITLINEEFSSISIEVYPMDIDEYSELVEVGVDGLAVYQETYNREIYKEQHPYGKKSDYDWRLGTPERGAIAGIRAIQIGALIGLDDFRREMVAMAIHLDYLSKKYPSVEFSISLPRLRPIVGDSLVVNHPISDRDFVQTFLAFRILFPHIGITVSTRENEKMRNGLVPLGATKLSAGVSTGVGEHSEEDGGDEQFEISDNRSVEEMTDWLQGNGFQPVLHDWNSKLTRVS